MMEQAGNNMQAGMRGIKIQVMIYTPDARCS